MKLILILVIITKNKIQVDNDGKKYILFRIDAYFTEYCLAIEIDEKGHTDGDPIFEQKREKVLEKKLNCTFIRFNTSKENFDVDCEVGKIQTFISNFNKSKIKELEDKIKERDNKNKELKEIDNKIKEIDNKNKGLKDEIKKLKLQLANLSVRNNGINDKK